MTPRTKELVMEALKRSSVDHRDNLRRSQISAKRHGADMPWCATTGKTIGQLMAEYQASVDAIEAAIREVEAL